jgi:hypothetical protein
MALSFAVCALPQTCDRQARTTMSRLYQRSQAHDELNENGWLTIQCLAKRSAHDLPCIRGKIQGIFVFFAVF